MSRYNLQRFVPTDYEQDRFEKVLTEAYSTGELTAYLRQDIDPYQGTVQEEYVTHLNRMWLGYDEDIEDIDPPVTELELSTEQYSCHLTYEFPQVQSDEDQVQFFEPERPYNLIDELARDDIRVVVDWQDGDVLED